MKLCDYGCKQIAKYKFKNGNYCCSKVTQCCPEKIKEQSIKQKGNKSSKYGTKSSKETKLKISKAVSGKNNPMWRKNFSIEHRKKLSEAGKGRKIVISEKQKRELKKIKTYSIEDWYEKYPMLKLLEELRYNPNNSEEIQAHCNYNKCINSKENGGWFTPTRQQLRDRIMITNSFDSCGNFLYCSKDCKQSCPMYNLKSDPNKKLIYSIEEYSIWRQEVLKQSNYKCEYCGNEAKHCHHSRPQKLEPFFSLDPDYGIACCMECHYKYGHKNECSTIQLAKKICI